MQKKKKSEAIGDFGSIGGKDPESVNESIAQIHTEY